MHFIMLLVANGNRDCYVDSKGNVICHGLFLTCHQFAEFHLMSHWKGKVTCLPSWYDTVYTISLVHNTLHQSYDNTLLLDTDTHSGVVCCHCDGFLLVTMPSLGAPIGCQFIFKACSEKLSLVYPASFTHSQYTGLHTISACRLRTQHTGQSRHMRLTIGVSDK